MLNALENGYIWIIVMEILYPSSIFSDALVTHQHDNPAREIISCKYHDVLVIGLVSSATNTPKYVGSCFQK